MIYNKNVGKVLLRDKACCINMRFTKCFCLGVMFSIVFVCLLACLLFVHEKHYSKSYQRNQCNFMVGSGVVKGTADFGGDLGVLR